MLPKVGQTVLVTLASKWNKNTGFNGKLTTSKRIVQKITRIYEGGHIGTSSGDIWEVKPLSTGKADFITVEAADA